MKKRILIFIIVGLLIGFYFTFRIPNHKEVLNDVTGTIYYLDNYKDEKAIYRANADLTNIELIYSHVGKSQNIESTQEGVSDFRYFEEIDTIAFEAKHKDKWSLFQLSLDTMTVEYISEVNDELYVTGDYVCHSVPVDYIKLKQKDVEIFEDDASLFLRDAQGTRCLLKYKGLMRSDIPGMIGYYPTGLSPDNQYVIFGSNHSFTGLGGFLGLSPYKRYIMDVETGQYTEYVNSNNIQWLP